MTSEEKFNEITSFKKELERYESQGVFNDLEYKMEHLVYFGYEPPNTANSYKEELENFKIFILKIRQAEINELKLEIDMLKQYQNNQKEEFLCWLSELRINTINSHQEHIVDFIDNIIDKINEDF